MTSILVKALIATVSLQAASALFIGNHPRSRINERMLPLDVQTNVFARIFSRYDVAVVPSITDLTELHMQMAILKGLNMNYDLYVSPKLEKPGVTQPEHYGIIYRRNVVALDHYIRDQPTGILSVKVKVFGTGQEFVLSIVHLAGGDVVNQLELLPTTYERITKLYNLQNVLFVGDFNTADMYMTEAQYHNATVTKDPLYEWFIQWSENTLAVTVAQGAINRFLAAGDIKHWVKPDSPKVLNTMDFFNLTRDEAIGMAVMFPVEIDLLEPILRT